MQHIRTLTTAATHQVYRGLLVVTGRADGPDEPMSDKDRGAVSLEQVLWFVAAGISVAVIASILWSQIRDEAERPVQTPSSP
jgi:hypothetical protein